MNKNNKIVFVSGCFDLLHSGHIEFLRRASTYGNLYVGIGSDQNIYSLKGNMPMFSQDERLFMVESIMYVYKAFINKGMGIMDFVEEVKELNPDIFIVNEDGHCGEKEDFCKENNIEYVVLNREPYPGLDQRSSSEIKQIINTVPTRIDIAGGWLDQIKLSSKVPGWVITLSLNANFPILNRSGMATSTRETISKLWSYKFPDINEENLAKLVFSYENFPTKDKIYYSGAQDSIGICLRGLTRHYYNGNFWPSTIEQCLDNEILDWLEKHICLVPLFEREKGFDVYNNSNNERQHIEKLAHASASAWDSIVDMNLDKFAKAFNDSFEAQVSLFPSMLPEKVKKIRDKYMSNTEVLATKLSGCGGGGYLILVCRDKFPKDAIQISSRRY